MKGNINWSNKSCNVTRKKGCEQSPEGYTGERRQRTQGGLSVVSKLKNT